MDKWDEEETTIETLETGALLCCWAQGPFNTAASSGLLPRPAMGKKVAKDQAMTTEVSSGYTKYKKIWIYG